MTYCLRRCNFAAWFIFQKYTANQSESGPKTRKNSNDMETQQPTKSQTVAELYRSHSGRILNYIRTRIENKEEAENLAQDVWIKILESEVALATETALAYIYKVAANLINDYLRKLYVRIETREEVEKTYTERTPLTPLQEYMARELAAYEMVRVECLPPQRRTIYKMSRFDDMPVADIADSLQLSFRTVENHLRMGRKDVRSYIAAIA